MLLAVLTAVAEDRALTQRRLAQGLGIALGLANRCLNRCSRMGLIEIARAHQPNAPPHGYRYSLTPKGFSEKNRLAARALHASFEFYRTARAQCAGLLAHAAASGWRRLVLFGASELGEIAALCATGLSASGGYPLDVLGFVDEASSRPELAGLPVVERVSKLGKFDAAFLTDLNQPQTSYDRLRQSIPADRILAPALLGVTATPAVPLE